MYLPKHNEESRVGVLHDLIRAYPLGALITSRDAEIAVNHLPFLVGASDGLGTLHGHVARANPIWEALDEIDDCVVVFQGPESYVSPSWYPGKATHGRVVPTWNYAVVHAHGRPRAIDDAEWVRGHLERLTDEQESRMPTPWQVADAPDDFVRAMAGQVVGIEIPIAGLSGKWKMSQNRSHEDRLGVIAGLESLEGGRAAAVARLVARSLDEADAS